MQQAKRGRPPKGEELLMKAITVRFPAAMMRQIQAIAETRADRPEKGQVIRELCALALEKRKGTK